MRPSRQIPVRCRRGHGRGPVAFTLVELLVVIAILCLLLTMVIPTLARARVLAKRTVCQVNLYAIGKATVIYQSEFGDVVPVCWANTSGNRVHLWKSWRAVLLDYASGYEIFNCPAVGEHGVRAELFHSAEEVLWHENTDTVNAGSYGVMYQHALPGYTPVDYAGIQARGHPMWTDVFSTVPGVSWRRPSESVYVADAVFLSGEVTYPSGSSHKGYGTSAILPPSDPGYTSGELTRRFADRHMGTACLFVDGHIEVYETKDLDGMTAGEPDCIWDVE